jgi:hypothetical protein
MGYPHGRGEVPAPRRIREVFRPGGRRLRREFARAGLACWEGDRDRGGPATPLLAHGDRHQRVLSVLAGRWLPLAPLLPALAAS